VSLASLLPSCAELRRGQQTVRLNIDPERAAEFIARIKATPAVIAAGWTSGKVDMERTVRFPAADWREGGKINKDKLANTLSAALAKALSATPLTTAWNDDSGELKLSFKRPNSSLPALALTQNIEIVAMPAADKPAGSDRLLLWLGYPTVTTTDEATGAKLRLADTTYSGEDDSPPVDDGDSLSAVARVLKAQRWDADNNSWK
jgi:hypothetical protein